MQKAIPLATLTMALCSSWLQAGVDQEIQAYMEKFHQNPAKVMDQLPPKTYQGGGQTALFSESSINSGQYIQYKDQTRQQVIQANKPKIKIPRAPINYRNDNPAHLVDLGYKVIKNLYTLEQKAPAQSSLDIQPWSDTYWPLYSGAAAWRYADDDLWAYNWKDYWDFSFVTKPVSSYVGSERDNLSPSEKYDLLMGDSSFSLTQNAWNSGKYYYDRYGNVQRWMGLCHGWAPAAYMLPRPTKTLCHRFLNPHLYKAQKPVQPVRR